MLRRTLGTLLRDLPLAWCATRRSGGWIRIHNRLDSLNVGGVPLGVRINSPHGSTIQVCDVFPWFGRRVLRKALDDWAFSFPSTVEFSESPDITFVIPHRGQKRESLLNMTIRSISANDASVDCIVVEQDEDRKLGPLPGNTKYLLARHPVENTSWHKAFALNLGVRHARGKIVILHDGDIPVPTRYASAILEHLGCLGNEVAFLQRFLFYLNRRTTDQLLHTGSTSMIARHEPEKVRQNWVGGTVGIRKAAFEKVGGFDESFKGWTGEDREFYDRCLTLQGYFFGYLPFLHLWHPPQPGKADACMRRAAEVYTQSRLEVAREVRIRELVAAQSSKG